MTRFWPTLGLVCMFAGILGLAGYGVWMASRRVVMDPQGKWLGPWPMAGADDCRTKLFADGRFELECRGKEQYAGKGRWHRESNHLVFEFNLYVRGGKLIENMSPMKLRMDGMRNTLCVGLPEERGEPFCWKRAPL